MKDCPVCKGEVSSFKAWVSKPVIFKIECQSCGVKLKAVLWFKLFIAIAFVIVVACIPLAEELLLAWEWDAKSRWLKLLLVLPVILVLGVILFLVAQYKPDK